VSAARIALAIAILLWAGWELFLAIEPGRKEFAAECQAKGWVLTSGQRGQMCTPNKP
jgi:hypothetical protein